MTDIYVRYPDINTQLGSTTLPLGKSGWRKLDLYKDETMDYISKVSDITKLDKVFSDFSKSFTVPATANNNEIFRHYYDIDVNEQYAYNPNIKVECYIEIDTIPYKYAAIQLEGVKIKENQVDSYSVGIFSSITQLTDLFGEDKIFDLDKNEKGEKVYNGLSKYDYFFTKDNFKKSIKDQSFNSGATLTPMINMSDKKWQLHGVSSASTSFLNITQTDAGGVGGFSSTATRPAFRLIHIIEAIEQKYKVKFTRDFFGKAEFMNLFMWMNRTEEITTDFTPTALCNTLVPETAPGNNTVQTTPDCNIAVTFIDNYYNEEGKSKQGHAYIIYKITPKPGFTNVVYSARIVNEDKKIRGGSLLLNGVKGTQTLGGDVPGMNKGKPFVYTTKVFKLEVKTSAPDFQFTVDVNACSAVFVGRATLEQVDRYFSNGNEILGVNKVIIADNLPDMKVSEFMQNIMKMFKLIIRPLALNKQIPEEENGRFYMTTLNSFYLQGEEKDITKNIDFTEVNIRKPDVFKEINFKYEPTKNVTGEFFRNNNPTNIGYGDLKISFSKEQVNTKNTLEIKVGWENMLFEKLLGRDAADNTTITNFMIGESISTDDDGKTFEKNKGKALIFYNIGVHTITKSQSDKPPLVQIPTDTTPVIVPLTDISVFASSNDSYLPQVTQSINFDPGALLSDVTFATNPELFVLDPWHGDYVQYGLFWTKWKNWIDEIYDFRQRKFTYKAVNFDPKTLTSLDLSDTLIIRDEKYKIEDMRINLSNGDTTLNLFRTFKPTETPSFFRTFGFGFSGDTRAHQLVTISDYIEDGENVIIYGDFDTVNGISKPHLVKITKSGDIVNEFDVGTGFEDWSIVEGGHKLLRIGNDLYVCGDFTAYNGVPSRNLVKLNYTTGQMDTSFTANFGFFSNTVTAIGDVGTGIVVGGEFTDINGSTHFNKAAILGYDGVPNLANNIFLDSETGNVTDVLPHFTPYSSGGPSVQRVVIVGTFTGGILDYNVESNIGGTFGITLTSNTAGAYIGLSKANEQLPNSFQFWIYGDLATFNGIPVNKMCLVDMSPGASGVSLVESAVPFEEVNGTVKIAKYLYENKVLVQGDISIPEGGGFTTFANINTTALVLTTQGEIYRTFPETGDFIYNIDTQFFSIPSETSKTVSPSLEDDIPIVSRNIINSTAGQMYYGIAIQKKLKWTATKVNAGNGTDWIKFISNKSGDAPFFYDSVTGVGFDECTFLVMSKVLPDPDPNKFLSRSMKIKLTFEDGSVSLIDVIQEGLTDPNL